MHTCQPIRIKNSNRPWNNSSEPNGTGNPACKPEVCYRRQLSSFCSLTSPLYTECVIPSNTERERVIRARLYSISPFVLYYRNIKNSLCLYVSLLNASEKTYALFLFHWPIFQGAALSETQTFTSTGCMYKVYALMLYLLRSLW